MKTSPTTFRERFLESALDLLWGQWTTLGVAGHGERENRVIDLDALLLGTCVFGRHEPRLFDEMLDWLGKNGWCINVQRVRSLLRQYGYGCERALAAVAACQAKGAETAKWRRLSLGAAEAEPGAKLEPLFYLADGRSQPAFGRAEPHFARYGFHRGDLELRGMSQAPNPETPASLMFRLRALFGVNARADILAYLLTHPEGHPPEVARQTGYFPKTVQMALAEMACSGAVQVIRKGREKHYRVEAAEWRLVGGAEGARGNWPGWVSWPQFFGGMTGVWRLAQDRELTNASPALQAAEWQKAMGRAQPWLAQSGAVAGPKELKRLSGAAYLKAVQEELLRLFNSKPH